MNKKYALTLITIVLLLNVNIPIVCLSETSAQTKAGESITISHRLVTTESDFWIMGEVINNKDVSVKDLRVTITLYDHGHNVMNETSVHSWLDVILPQRRSVFMAQFEKQDVGGFATYEITIESYEPCQDKPIGLVITETVVYVMPERTIIEGKIRNNGPETTNYILIVALFYDSQGFLETTSDQIVAADGVAPNDEWNFRIYSRFANLSNLERCVVTAGSVDVSPSPFVSYAVQEEITRIWQPEDEANDYYAIIGAVVIIVVIIAVVLVAWKKKRKSRPAKRLRNRKAHLRKSKNVQVK